MSDQTVTVSPQAAFAVIGELYLENRILREQLAQAQAEIAELKKPKEEGAAP